MITPGVFSQEDNSKSVKIEGTDVHIYEEIESKIKGFDKVEMTQTEQKFLNGIVRKYKPKKILEIGVAKGGSSAIILNAIKDIEDAKLYSVDLSVNCYRDTNKKTGFLVAENFPHLQSKWELHTGGISASFIETIGKDIDLCFIDTMHVTPGEMLDILTVLPFLKENAVIVLHDVGMHLGFLISEKNEIVRVAAACKANYCNNQIFAYLKGKKMVPETKGADSFYHDTFYNIGAVELDSNQENAYFDYFFALSFHWQYMPDSAHLKILRDLFKKYYDEKYVKMFDEAINANKFFLNV